MRKRYYFIILALLAGVFFFGEQTLAQTASDQLENVGEIAQVSDKPLMEIIGDLINWLLGITGILLFFIILYAGFVWMTAGGNADKVDKAKKILLNAVIGMIIIFASYAISDFLFKGVFNAATDGGSSYSTSSGSVGSGRIGSLGGGENVDFSVTRFRPEGEVSVRNVRLNITFNQKVDVDTIGDALSVMNTTTGQTVDGIAETYGNRVIFTPNTTCPEPNEERFCFDADTTYAVVLQPTVLSTSGENLTCDSESTCSSHFHTGSVIDTKDPIVRITAPDDGEAYDLGELADIQVEASDDSEISVADFFVGDILFDSVPAFGNDLSDVFIETSWDTQGAVADQRYRLSVTVTDIAGNEDSDSLQVEIRPELCSNGVKDVGEEDIDCGGNCGICDGGSCVENIECADGICENNTCVEKPVVESMLPRSGAPGTYVTLTGRRFGEGGEVRFLAQGGGTVVAEVPDCSEGWSDTKVIVKVPENALSGEVVLVNQNTLQDGTMDDNGPLVGSFDLTDTLRPNICRISPPEGRSGGYVTIIGENFGEDESLVHFDSTEVETIRRWDSMSIDAMVPALRTDEYQVKVTVDGVSSNPYVYHVESSTSSATVSSDADSSNTMDGNDTDNTDGTDNADGTGDADTTDDENTNNTDTTDDENTNNTGTTDGNDTDNTDGTDNADGTGDVDTTDDDGETGVDVDAAASRVITIGSLSPSVGGIGQYVTIQGSGFGDSLGVVRFENKTSGYVAVADIDFPEVCVENVWEDDTITVKVPAEYTNGEDVENGIYNLVIIRADGQVSDAEEFLIDDSVVTPGICAVEPANGLPGEEIVLTGSNFGDDEGTVLFFNEAVADILDWSDDQITLSVPGAAQTGPLQVQQGETDSNEVEFEVQAVSSSGNLIAQPNGAGYAWTFSTGKIKPIPELIEACSDTLVSAVPNERFGGDVCTQAMVYGEFTVPMNISTFIGGENGTIIVTECANDTCTNGDYVPGWLETVSTSEATAFTWIPTSSYNSGDGLKYETTYEVSLSDELTSAQNISLRKPLSWTFTTGSQETEDCEVKEILVRPQELLMTSQGESGEYQAMPVTGSCQALNADQFSWAWSGDPSVASVEKGGCSDTDSKACAEVIALGEGETEITAQEFISEKEGAGFLTVEYTDPYVTTAWPECTDSCANGSVGAEFNIGMSSTIEQAGAVSLFACTNELCIDFSEEITDLAQCIEDENGECTEIQFITPGELNLDTYYRAIIHGTVTSASGVPLVRTNYGDNYSWTFRVKEDNAECGVARIELTPESYSAVTTAEETSFFVQAYGDTNTCSVAGQKLNSYAYDWQWESPIIDDEGVIDWVTINGGLFEGTNVSPVEGCTSSCLPSGSPVIKAICGDGDVEIGEECDDGNTINGDGCNTICLRDGGDPDRTCGDGVVDRNSYGGGEDCDDGNRIDGDGCSSDCLNEGSFAVGASCGNGDIAYSPEVGGEDCDDGNRISGDGCSVNCLNEGSANIDRIKARCGNGIIEAPYENCDDGNSDSGDGCSDRCLLEGSSSHYTEASVCGDGLVGTGEDEYCENIIAGSTSSRGKGCTETCILEGSSLEYDEPSVCGDGVVGMGEYYACEEYGLAGDGNTDPSQRVYVLDSAVEHVDQESQLASATVRVSLDEFAISDYSDFSLACVAENAYDCPDKDLYGVAQNHCCVARPQASLYPVSSVESGVCRNASIYGIFDQKMDLGSFEDNFFVVIRRDQLDAAGIDNCPVGYDMITEDDLAVETSTMKRWWSSLRGIIFPTLNAQELGDCSLPISKFTQEELEDGGWRVTATYNTLLAADLHHTIILKGDDVIDGEATGVLSVQGVGFASTSEAVFYTQQTACEIERIEVIDTNVLSPNLFTQANESHAFKATPYTQLRNNLQILEPIEGVYDWNWLDWIVEDKNADEDVFSVGLQDQEMANIGVTDLSGEGVAVAQVELITVDQDLMGIDNPEDGILSGTSSIEAILCEDPWPQHASYPFIDYVDSEDIGAQEGKGWTQFNVGYCKDGYLPDVSVIHQNTQTPGIVKEYLFKVNDGSGDAIGLRVAQNPTYLSPQAWYDAQGFVGATEALKVDGFEAVRAGRSVYVAAPNVAGGAIYPNIYILSHNEGAGSDTMAIFEQILQQISFASNVNNIGLCQKDGMYLQQSCSVDTDCSDGAICADDKVKIQRDMKRLSDLVSIQHMLLDYEVSHGKCSISTEQSCVRDVDCPQEGEVCMQTVPTVDAGTAIRSLVSSEWSTWDTILGNALGQTLPKDPIMGYGGLCGVGDYEAFDSLSCVNDTAGTYVCPKGAYAYHYRSLGDYRYELSAELEYKKSDWINPIDTSYKHSIQVGGNSTNLISGFTGSSAICSGSVYGEGGLCGDGIVSPGEVCEVGQKGPAESCTLLVESPLVTISVEGSLQQVCNSTCSGYEAPEGATCQALECGNGIKEQGEECDDGEFNGQYGFCGNDCTFSSAFFCGDGTVAGGEACDCGVDGSSGRNIAGLSCRVGNGVYTANPNESCSWNCTEAASFCGDGEVDDVEQCDGNVETWTGSICKQGGRFGVVGVIPCETDDECGDERAVCDETTVCPVSTVCIAGSDNMNGRVCTTNADCDTAGMADGVCSSEAVQTMRVKTCADNGVNGDLCTWNEWSSVCQAPVKCGNGVIEEGEECDDGNNSNNDSCTNLCRINVCGDGYIEAGIEACDNGEDNGELCTAPYGSTCNYCSSTCKLATTSGAFCGDGVINGREYCDNGDIPMSYISEQGELYLNDQGAPITCTVEGSTTNNYGESYTCQTVGVCNGGVNNGEYCTTSGGFSSCDGGSCVYPSCKADCSNTCPTSFSHDTLLMRTNSVGAPKTTSISLVSYDEEVETRVLTESNAASIYFPSCTVANALTADVEFNFTPDPVYVIFVTDRSGSMGISFPFTRTSRMTVAKESLQDAVGTLFEDVDDMHIGLISFSSDSTWDTGGIACTNGFCTAEYEAQMDSKIDDYNPGGATHIDLAIKMAKERFDEASLPDNARKIVVLLADGAASTDHEPDEKVTTLKENDVELYTVALTTDQSLIAEMNGWSSGNPDPETGIDYAYNASSSTVLQTVYDTIVESILGVHFGYVVNSDLVTGAIVEGRNVTLPWPVGFACQPGGEFSLPIRVSFNGEGTIDIKDVKFQYCSP